MPIVSRGDHFVYSQSFADLREFLGLPAEPERLLGPDELARKVTIVLRAALRYVHQMPDAVLDEPFRNSWALPRGLAHHVFRIVEAFMEAVDRPEPLTYELIMRGTHDVRPGDDVTGFGKSVLSRFGQWWDRHRLDDFGRTVPTYYGDQTLQATLERTAWHSAQHTRQLMVVLEANGVPIDAPLTPDDLAGLPLPEKPWDDET